MYMQQFVFFSFVFIHPHTFPAGIHANFTFNELTYVGSRKTYLNEKKSSERKKRSERRKHGALRVVRRSQKFRPATDPFLAGAGPPKFNQLEMVTTFTYRPSLVKIDTRNFELSW